MRVAGRYLKFGKKEKIILPYPKDAAAQMLDEFSGYRIFKSGKQTVLVPVRGNAQRVVVAQIKPRVDQNTCRLEFVTAFDLKRIAAARSAGILCFIAGVLLTVFCLLSSTFKAGIFWTVPAAVAAFSLLYIIFGDNGIPFKTVKDDMKNAVLSVFGDNDGES